MGVKLQFWNKRCFGNVKRKIEAARSRMQSLLISEPDCLQSSLHKAARTEMNKWLERNEIMWRQRSKVLWLKDGDKNTKFFIIKLHKGEREILLQESKMKMKFGIRVL